MEYRSGTETYYRQMLELQDKLRKSEEGRLKLEEKFNEIMQHSRDAEYERLRIMRHKYHKFLEEDKLRQERNENILRTLDRIESRAKQLAAKTDRFKAFRKQYFENYLKQIPKQKQQTFDSNTQSTNRSQYQNESVRRKLFSDQPMATVNENVETKLALLEKYLRDNFDNFPRDFPTSTTKQNEIYDGKQTNVLYDNKNYLDDASDSKESQEIEVERYSPSKMNGHLKSSELLGNRIEQELDRLRNKKENELNNNSLDAQEISPEQVINDYKKLVSKSEEKFGLRNGLQNGISNNTKVFDSINKIAQIDEANKLHMDIPYNVDQKEESSLKLDLLEEEENSEDTKPPTDISLNLTSPSQLNEQFDESKQVEMPEINNEEYLENSSKSEEITSIEKQKVQKKQTNYGQQENINTDQQYIEKPLSKEFGESISNQQYFKENPKDFSEKQQQEYPEQQYVAPQAENQGQLDDEIQPNYKQDFENTTLQGQGDRQYESPGQQHELPKEQYERTVQQFEKPEPQYENPEQQYENLEQQYENLEQQYENPKQQYENPEQQYENSKQQYDNPEQQYENPKQQYENPEKQYEKSKQQYENLEQYEKSKQQYENPEQYENPKQQSENSKQQYENPEQQYENPKQQYENPEKYENPEQQYENPEQQYENPEQQYENPKQQYENPEQQYENPEQQYENPEQQYKNPEQLYKNPEQQYENSEHQSEAPEPEKQYPQTEQQYVSPEQQLETLGQQYESPEQQYEAPEQQYDASEQQYMNPEQQYSSPEQQEYPPENYDQQYPQQTYPEGEYDPQNYPQAYETQQPENYDTQNYPQQQYPEGYDAQYTEGQQLEYVQQYPQGEGYQDQQFVENTGEYGQQGQYAENLYQTGQEYLEGEQNVDLQYEAEQQQEYPPDGYVGQEIEQNVTDGQVNETVTESEAIAAVAEQEQLEDNKPLIQKKLPNLADMLDTDTSESVKPDSKVSDSDFDFSNTKT